MRGGLVVETVSAADFGGAPGGGGVVVVQGEEGGGVEVGDVVFFCWGVNFW